MDWTVPLSGNVAQVYRSLHVLHFEGKQQNFCTKSHFFQDTTIAWSTARFWFWAETFGADWIVLMSILSSRPVSGGTFWMWVCITWFSLAEDSMKAAFHDSARAFPSSQLMTLRKRKCYVCFLVIFWFHRKFQPLPNLIWTMTEAPAGTVYSKPFKPPVVPIGTYRSMCKSFLLPTSMMGTLQGGESQMKGNVF